MARRRRGSVFSGGASREEADAIASAEAKKKREDRNKRIREERAEREIKKQEAHTQMRAKGQEENRKRRQKKAKARTGRDKAREEVIGTRVGGKWTGGTADVVEEVANENADRLAKKGKGQDVKASLRESAKAEFLDKEKKKLRRSAEVKKRQRKHKTDFLSAPIGEGTDLEHQDTLKKTAMKMARGNPKKAKEIMERRAKGGVDFTDEDKAKFDAEWKSQLTKALPKEARGLREDPEVANKYADDIVARQPKLQREAEVERIEARKVFQDKVDPQEVTSTETSLGQKGEDGRTNAEVMQAEGVGLIVDELNKDGDISDDDLKNIQGKFNEMGDESLDDFKYDPNTGAWTAKITNKKTGESRDMEITEGRLKGLTNTFSKMQGTQEALDITQKKSDIATTGAKKRANIEVQKQLEIGQNKALSGKPAKIRKQMEAKFKAEKAVTDELISRAEGSGKVTTAEVKKIKDTIATLKLSRGKEAKSIADSDDFDSDEYLKSIDARIDELDGALKKVSGKNKLAQDKLTKLRDQLESELKSQAETVGMPDEEVVGRDRKAELLAKRNRTQ